jgi:thiol-disulfide isomerase/thioredoxin
MVVLNIWATWCTPCREEMPALDRLQAQLGGPEFEVVALSVDQQGAEPVRKFFSEVGIEALERFPVLGRIG